VTSRIHTQLTDVSTAAMIYSSSARSHLTPHLRRTGDNYTPTFAAAPACNHSRSHESDHERPRRSYPRGKVQTARRSRHQQRHPAIYQRQHRDCIAATTVLANPLLASSQVHRRSFFHRQQGERRYRQSTTSRSCSFLFLQS